MNMINWNELWKEMNRQAGTDNSSDFWDAFAPRFRKKVKDKDPYVEQFYELAEIKPGDTLFDMGCGSGTLAIPYAKKGHEVYAADFSQGMLDNLMMGAAEEGVADRIHPIKLDWNEDWSQRELPVCDVAFSSRSIICDDLTQALKNLESVARRRCCMAVWDSPNSGYDRYVADAVGYERPGCGTYVYVLNELIDRDVFPELLFVKSPFRSSKYETFEQGVEKLRGGFERPLTEEQERIFLEYCNKHLVFHIVEDGGGVSARKDAQGKKEFWQLDHDTMSTTAFIRWDKENVYGKIR